MFQPDRNIPLHCLMHSKMSGDGWLTMVWGIFQDFRDCFMNLVWLSDVFWNGKEKMFDDLQQHDSLMCTLKNV